jgi:hypothetical protein
LRIGPLDYPGLRNGFQSDPAQTPNRYDVRFYKTGVQLPAETSVTVSIGAGARSFAGIATEGGRDGGYTSVRYTSCPRSGQPAPVFWIGGFLLYARSRACIPIDVHVRGEKNTRFAEVAIPSGACG